MGTFGMGRCIGVTRKATAVTTIAAAVASAVLALSAAAAGAAPVHRLRSTAKDASTAAWQVQTAPAPSAANDPLDAVSCPSSAACEAVGTKSNGTSNTGTPFAERWNGTKWTLQAVPAPPKAASASLTAISCSAANACIAVGDWTDSAGHLFPLAAHWNGSAWSLEAVPLPSGVASGALTGVSCLTTGCTAVGYTVGSDGYAPSALAEQWNGSSWSIQPLDLPSGAVFSDLNGVSCSASGDCTAVGSYCPGASDQNCSATTPPASAENFYQGSVLVERWRGAAWSQVKAPNASSGVSFLQSVSCTSARACMAGGGYTYFSSDWLLEQHTPWGWRRRRPGTASQPEIGGTVAGVACATAADCVAVGNESGGIDWQSTIDQWDGTHWLQSTFPLPSGAYGNELQSVSCSSPGSCVAVGWYDDGPGSAQQALIETDSASSPSDPAPGMRTGCHRRRPAMARAGLWDQRTASTGTPKSASGVTVSTASS